MDEGNLQDRAKRREKLEFMYSRALDLLTYEGNLFANRSGHAVTTQAILFSAYFVVANRSNINGSALREIQLLICGAGIIFLLSYTLLVARNLSSASFWRARVTSIEQESDFWFPGDKSNFSELDLLCSRGRSLQASQEGEASKDAHSIRETILSSLNRVAKDPLDFYTIYFPIIFMALWVILALVSLHV